MSATENLTTAIDALRSALCAGNLSALASLAEQMGAELSELEATGPGTEDLAVLRAKAAEVESLLAAAGRGLIAGRRRLAEVRELQRGLGTYDREGRKLRLAPEATVPPRRA
jgi:hypothetical protein